LRLVIDACLPDWLTDVLSAVVGPPRSQIEHVTRLYGQGCKDVDWIGRLSADGGAVFLTLDKHMRRRPIEVQALIASRCVGIVLTSDWQLDEDYELAARVFLHWPKIEATSEMTPPQMLELTRALKPRGTGRWRGWDKIASSNILRGQAGASSPKDPK
jgi:hypothetical protein